MKPTKETAAFLKLLNQYEDWRHIGQELASSMSADQDQNFNALVYGYNEIIVILHGGK